MMRILITNDDGIEAPGLTSLANILHNTGHDILVVAPQDECSGAAGAIGPIGIPHYYDITRREIATAPGIEAYAVAAYPAVCVLTAMLGAFGQSPDIVFSGINEGANVGRSVMHSGTVSAALTGAMHGARGVAISVAGQKVRHWDTAAAIALSSLEWVIKQPAATVININVPDHPKAQLRGIRSATLSPLNQLRASMTEKDNSRRIALDLVPGDDPDHSDASLLRQGFATITHLTGICIADESILEELLSSASSALEADSKLSNLIS